MSDEKYSITINVAGHTGSGKSTITQMVANALRAAGFDTVVHHQDQEAEWVVQENLSNRVNAIRDKCQIQITNTSVRRS